MKKNKMHDILTDIRDGNDVDVFSDDVFQSVLWHILDSRYYSGYFVSHPNNFRKIADLLLESLSVLGFNRAESLKALVNGDGKEFINSDNKFYVREDYEDSINEIQLMSTMLPFIGISVSVINDTDISIESSTQNWGRR